MTLLKTESASDASASVLRKGREDVAPHTHHILWLPASDTMPLHGGVNSGPRKHGRRGRRVARLMLPPIERCANRNEGGEAAARRVDNAARERTRREQEGEEEAAARREIDAAATALPDWHLEACIHRIMTALSWRRTCGRFRVPGNTTAGRWNDRLLP